MDPAKKAELHRRRQLRLEQVRQQSKDIAQDLRCRVAAEKKRKEAEFAKAKCKELKEWQEQQMKQLQDQYSKSVCEIGNGHKQAAEEPDAFKVLQEKKDMQDKISAKRGKEAMSNLKLKNQEKLAAKSCRKSTFRSVVIASPNKRKIKVTHIIKGSDDKSKQRKEVSDNNDLICDENDDDSVANSVIHLKNSENADTEKNNDCDLIGDDYCSTLFQCNDKLSLASSSHECQCCKSTKIIKPVVENIIIDSDESNSWVCKCCKRKRSVGTQCICVCSKSKASIKSRATTNAIDPLVVEHISAMNRNTAHSLSPTKTKGIDVFTQVSDRIKSRHFVDVSNSPKSQRNKGTSTEKSYNPDNFICSSEKNVETNQRFRDLSPLTEVSDKIQYGVQNAKKHLEDIEPDVVELKRNIDILSRGCSREYSQSTKKSFKQTSPIKSDKTRTVTIGVGTDASCSSKTKLYDSNNKFAKEYQAPSSLVERINSNEMSAHDLARKERQDIDKVKLVQSQKQKADLTKSKIRGQKALNQQHNLRRMNKISESLGLLAQQEKAVTISQDPGFHRGGQLKELENRRQEEINRAFENVLNEDGVKVPSNVITLKRVKKTKGKGKENVEKMTTVVTVPADKISSKHTRLNVGNYDIPSGSAKITSCPKPYSPEDKSSSSSSSIIVGHIEDKTPNDVALQDLLNRVNHQRQMLLEEVSKQDLPQNSKLDDVLDAVEKSLLNNTADTLEHIQEKNISITKSTASLGKLEEAREIKKQKKKLAKKEEELKLKELQLDMLIQKQKLNELEEKQKGDIKSCDKVETTNVSKDNIVEHSKEAKQEISTLNQLTSSSSEQVSSGVEIVIKVKDKSRKNNLSTPKKYSIQAKGPSLVQKHRKVTPKKRNKTECKTKVTKPCSQVCEVSATSSTSYMSPPNNISNISKLVNLPRTLPKESTNLSQFQQFKQQTNICNNDFRNLPNAMQHYMYEPGKKSNRLEDKCQQKQENPQLLKYINKLLSMSRGSIDALTVSSCSEEPTPSTSIINISSNNPQEKTKPNINHVNKITERSHVLTSTFENSYDKIPSMKLPLSPNKATQTNFGIDKCTQVTKESSQSPVTKLQNKATQLSKENKICFDVESLDASVNKTAIDVFDSQNDEVQRLTDNCNQRISNLADLILKVRQEKLRLLESSLSSSSSVGQNSTEYLDLPHNIQEKVINNYKVENVNSKKDAVERSPKIFDESPPQMNVTDSFETGTFVPMLKDIPKPLVQNINIRNEIMDPNKINQSKDVDDANMDGFANTAGIKFEINEHKSEKMENEISGLKHNVDGLNRQLSNLENCMGKIQEYIGDIDYSERHRQKPPVSLLRHIAQTRNNTNIDAGQAHELSAIIEVETPGQSHISESNLDIITISEEITERSIAGKSKEQLPDCMGKLQNIEKRLKNIFDENMLSITLKSPSKCEEKSSDKVIDTDLEIQPFPTFEEYAQKLDSRTSDDNTNTLNFSYHPENDKSSELNIPKNEETLPDVLTELMRRKILRQPFDNDTQSTDTSTIELFDTLARTQVNVEKYIPIDEKFSKTLSVVSLMSDSSIENSTTTNSTSPDFERALQKLGLNWALSTLKKTQESMALSSSSSIDYPSPETNYLTKRIMALKNLNDESFKEIQNIQQPLPNKVTIESSCTESSDGQVKRISQKTEFKDSSSSNEQTEGTSNLRSFLAQELAKKARNISLDKEAIFRSLMSGNNTSDINATLVPSPQANQRTSTPVLGDRKTSSSSKGNSLHDTLFSGSNLSSVKNNSSDNAS